MALYRVPHRPKFVLKSQPLVLLLLLQSLCPFSLAVLRIFFRFQQFAYDMFRFDLFLFHMEFAEFLWLWADICQQFCKVLCHYFISYCFCPAPFLRGTSITPIFRLCSMSFMFFACICRLVFAFSYYHCLDFSLLIYLQALILLSAVSSLLLNPNNEFLILDLCFLTF